MAQIVWNRRAVKQFGQIQDYLTKQFGEASTTQFTQRVFLLLELLVKYTELGTLEEPQLGIRGFLLHKHTRIFYKAKAGKLYIYSIFDTRQSPDRKLP